MEMEMEKEMERERERRQYSASSKAIALNTILDILAKLPVKSVLRFRCVSKFCYSSVLAPSFVKAHTTHFPIKPIGLLITCSDRLRSGQMFFNSDFNGGSAVPLLTVPPRFSRYTTQSVNGLVCLDFGLCAKICNPSTRQVFTLPFVSSPSAASLTFHCVNSFGFDPVNNQYKVLNSWKFSDIDTEYRVFTLGTDSWRLIHGGPSLYPTRGSICIDGVVYFRCWNHRTESMSVLAAFEVENETFREIKIPHGISSKNETESDLIVLAGRLAIVLYDKLDGYGGWTIWAMKDHESWVNCSVVLPSALQELQEQDQVLYNVAGTVPTGELLLAPRSLSKQFYVVYYDLKKSTFRRVEISGLPDYAQINDFCSIDTVTVSNYEENVFSFA